MFVISSLHTDNKSIDLPKDEIIHGDNYHITKHLLEDDGYTYTINGTCEIVFNSLQRLRGSRNCKRKTNSKKQEIYCTNDMKVCKTQDEIINKVKLNFSSFPRCTWECILHSNYQKRSTSNNTPHKPHTILQHTLKNT